jgi:hypothetical protein
LQKNIRYLKALPTFWLNLYHIREN